MVPNELYSPYVRIPGPRIICPYHSVRAVASNFDVPRKCLSRGIAFSPQTQRQSGVAVPSIYGLASQNWASPVSLAFWPSVHPDCGICKRQLSGHILCFPVDGADISNKERHRLIQHVYGFDSWKIVV